MRETPVVAVDVVAQPVLQRSVIAAAQRAIDHLALNLDAQHDVEIIRQLIGLGPDQARADAVDGAMKGLLVNACELLREMIAERAVVQRPEGTAAATMVFLQPGLHS